MTKDDIIRMARESGMCGFAGSVVCDMDELERFAALVAADERKVCAEVCAEIAGKQQTLGRRFAASECYSAIHARGKNDTVANQYR